ncbi:BQ2448_5044 [Microbotryum intermedium]|uniref:BQ2448_5044 protein n=1 Tax=Microbotryum intermedium TaxID=269621 RepID=A0A238F640_9BASI|nr:BQ2448_5044 [Microbotryum intermedium]
MAPSSLGSSSSSFELSSSYLATLEHALVQTTQHADQLPLSSDLSFERTLSRALAKKLDAQSERVLGLVQNLLSWSTLNQDPKASSSSSSASQATLDADLLRDGVYTNVVDRIEPLLEAADDELEIYLGVSKNTQSKHAPRSDAPLSKGKAAWPPKDRLASHLLHDPNLVKPQLAFPKRLCLPRPSLEDQDVPLEGPIWRPLLRRKLNPLASSTSQDPSWLRVVQTQNIDRFTSITGTAPPSYPMYLHPYQLEIEQLSPPQHYSVRPEPPRKLQEDSFDTTPFEWVDNKDKFDAMLSHIREMGKQGKRELAIDLEHHDQRCWGGITCLIQLSTRTQDYVIDALDPVVRDLLEGLNEFTTDPEWIKVFHGAASDIIWLQRDFGVYIVGLFDTYHATRVLDYPHHSLASLLERYTDFVPDKRYQLADWRIRPLPEAMLHYARSDTHYLLDVYDHLRIALYNLELSSGEKEQGEGKNVVDSVEPSPLVRVFDFSKAVSLSTFSIPPYDSTTGHFENGWLGLLAKNGQLQKYASALRVPTLPIRSGWGPGELHFELLKALHRWRERVAREEDEGINWVLSNWALFNLAEQGPKEVGEVMRVVGATAGRNGGVGEVMRRRKGEVLDVILKVVKEVESKSAKSGGEVVVVSEAMKERGEAAKEPVVRPVVDSLWSDQIEDVAAVKVVANSSFFGGRGKPSTSTSSTQGSSNLVASKSAFFGSSSSSKIPAPTVRVASDATPQRVAAIARIHSSLLLGGGLASVRVDLRWVAPTCSRTELTPLLYLQSLQGAKVPKSQAITSSDEPIEPKEAAQDAVDAHVEALTGDHFFIPFGERATKEAPIPSTSTSAKPAAVPKRSDKDVIVVSSLADKPKKKKRALPSPSNEADSTQSAAPSASTSASAKPIKPSPTKKTKREVLDVEPHDYSTSKSILDADPSSVAALTQGKKGKKKQKETTGRAAKGFVVDTSEFRKEPRVNNAPKKGNFSRSFAK